MVLTTIYCLFENEGEFEDSNSSIICAFSSLCSAEQKKYELEEYHAEMTNIKDEYRALTKTLAASNPPNLSIRSKPKLSKPIVTHADNKAWKKIIKKWDTEYEEYSQLHHQHRLDLENKIISILVEKYGDKVKNIESYFNYGTYYTIKKIELFE